MCESIQFTGRILSFLIITLASTLSAFSVYAQDVAIADNDFLNNVTEPSDKDSLSLFAFLYKAQDVSISLSSKVKTIKSNFEKEQATEGTISVTADGETYKFSSKFELGGKTRRKICRFAPVKINIKKKELKAVGFTKDMDKTKIVFQCNNSKKMSEAIKMEKLIYDLYAVVSPYARRSRVITVQIEGEDDILSALLLEDDDDFEIRTNTEVLKSKTIAVAVLNRKEYVKMCLFQYMISNSDWSARQGHNTDLYRRLKDNSLICVPYDFDYSGIINNSYALAPKNLPIQDVTDRYFMDKKVTLKELKVGVSTFLENEEAIIKTIDETSYLSDKSKKKMKKFIGDFYKIIKNQKKVQRLIK